jgi:type IV pilus assembly protein PilB
MPESDETTAPEGMSDARVERLLLDMNVVSGQDLQRAKRLQAKSKYNIPLAAVLEELEVVQEGQIREVAEEQNRVREEYRRHARIGDLVDYIVREAIELNASDIHLEPLAHRLRMRYRIDGVLLYRTTFPKDVEARILSRFKVMAGADIAEHRRHQDGRFTLTVDGMDVDLRMSSYVTVHGENIVLRILNRQVGLIELENLGFAPRTLQNYIDFVLRAPAGVVLITGPTGSGKTTTLYSSLDYCNNIGIKIITAEDPVEYTIDGVMQCSINEKIGLTYRDTLRAVVRQDPDVIVLGEIRDLLSAQTAVQAALTGHKVFTTFHTEDTVGALLRLMDMDIDTFLIASTVAGVVAQRLLRRICPQCREEAQPDPKTLYLLGVDPQEASTYPLVKGRGCQYCHYTGYKGRTAVYELLFMSEEIKEAVLLKQTSHQIREVSMRTAGLVTMQESAIASALLGETTFDEVLNETPRAFRPRPLKKILELLGIQQPRKTPAKA